MKTLLVTGASGLLGSKIVDIAKEDYAVVSVHNTKSLQPTSLKLDMTDPVQLSNVFKEFKPDAVVHAASETNVDRCEEEKSWAWKTNVEGTHNIALTCGEIKAKLIYISTDYVFDGKKGDYREQDKPNPVNFYGVTKLEGENQVTQHCRDCAILRTSVLYGWHPWKQNFVTWILNQLGQEKETPVITDHFNTPTLANNLAQITLDTIEEDLQGLYHASGTQKISRFKFAQQIAQIFDFSPSLIKPIKMNQMKAWTAPRPKDSSLNTDEIQSRLGTKLLNVTEGLRRMKAEHERDNPARRPRHKT